MVLLLQYTLTFASVLILVALGGCFSEHSGVINLGLEGVMIMGALGGALAMRYMPTNSTPIAMLLVVLAVLGGIGALVYFKFIKQKPKTKGSDNLDDYDYGEDDTEQEDADPWETEESDEPEDAGGGGDEESENSAK